MKNPHIGRVTLVGAGPGDPELLTLKAVRAICRADVIVHDRLVSAEILDLAPAHVRCIDVGKKPGNHALPQDQINELLISLALQGNNVTRLKGGDPLIFGRGGEEIEALREAGIGFSCIPGITAAQGAAAALGIPLTHRGLATGLRYVTGHRAGNASLNLDWQSLARQDTTLAVYMAAATIGTVAAELIKHGLPPSMPVLAISSATTPRERRILTTISRVSKDMPDVTAGDPLLFIIGHTAALHGDREQCSQRHDAAPKLEAALDG